MKDKRIWIVIGCILFIGTGVTHYTKYYVNSQGAAMMAEITAGAEDTAAAPSFAPALGQQDTEAGYRYGGGRQGSTRNACGTQDDGRCRAGEYSFGKHGIRRCRPCKRGSGKRSFGRCRFRRCSLRKGSCSKGSSRALFVRPGSSCNGGCRWGNNGFGYCGWRR